LSFYQAQKKNQKYANNLWATKKNSQVGDIICPCFKVPTSLPSSPSMPETGTLPPRHFAMMYHQFLISVTSLHGLSLAVLLPCYNICPSEIMHPTLVTSSWHQSLKDLEFK
jgi:hypothetical protein